MKKLSQSLCFTVIALTLAACSMPQKQLNFGEKVKAESANTGHISQQWLKGDGMITEGDALVKNGNKELKKAKKLVANAEAKIDKGEAMIKKGTSLRNEAQKMYQKKPPSISTEE